MREYNLLYYLNPVGSRSQCGFVGATPFLSALSRGGVVGVGCARLLPGWWFGDRLLEEHGIAKSRREIDVEEWRQVGGELRAWSLSGTVHFEG